MRLLASSPVVSAISSLQEHLLAPDGLGFKSYSLQVSNILSSVKNNNAFFKGLLSVSKELIPIKFLLECLTHAINIMRTNYDFISLDGRASLAIPIKTFKEKR